MAEQTTVTPYRTLPLQVCRTHSQRHTQNVDHKLHDYHKLLRMKKMLVETEQKMNNRIRLFKKASEKLIKKREIQVKTFTRIETAKSHPFFLHRIKGRHDIQTAQGRKRRVEKEEKENEQEVQQPNAEKIMLEKYTNVKTMKEEKERFKVLIQERRKVDLQRKLQSASAIRQRRENVKIARQHLEKSRKEQFQKQMQAKYDRERHEFSEMERHLSHLQAEEEEALKAWKRTMDTPYICDL